MPPNYPEPGDLDGREVAICGLGGAARALRRRVDDATATPVEINYRLAPEWSYGVFDAIDDLEHGLATETLAVLLLCEHALERLERACIDDSDGWLNQMFPRLESLHAAACKASGLTGETLAARLTAITERSDFEAFVDAADTHTEPLGTEGLTALERCRRR